MPWRQRRPGFALAIVASALSTLTTLPGCRMTKVLAGSDTAADSQPGLGIRGQIVEMDGEASL